MSVSPTLASEPDPLAALWEISLRARRGQGDPAALAGLDLAALSAFEQDVAEAVRAHLSAVFALIADQPEPAARAAAGAGARWAALATAPEVTDPVLTPRSHAFHMRLAARHDGFFAGVERRALRQWIRGAELKARFLAALAGADGADRLAQIVAISDAWREELSFRLPGLGEIEVRGARMAAQAGRGDLEALLSGRAAQLSDRLAPYPEDGPKVWAAPRKPEATLRFGFAATPVT